MICKNCNTQVPDGAKFCGICGGEIEETVVQAGGVPLQQPTNNNIDKPWQGVQTSTATTSGAKTKKEKKFLRGFLSVLCCIMIFVFTTTALSLAVVRQSLDEENVEELLEERAVEEIVSADFLEDNIKGYQPQIMRKFYEETEIGNYIDGIVLDYAEYLRGGDVPDGVSADEILTILGEESIKIEELIGKALSVRDYESISVFFGEDGEENLGVLSEDVRTNDTLKTLRIFLSVYTIIGFSLLALLFAILLLKVRRFRIDTMVWASVPIILSAVTLAVFGLIRGIALSMVSDLGEIAEIGMEIALSGISGAVITNTMTGFGIGAVLIVAYYITKSIKNVTKVKNASKNA